MSATSLLVIQRDWRQFAPLRKMLVERNFEIEWIADSERALVAAARNQHALVLLDLKLGDDDGLALLSQAVEAGCRRPIIVLGSEADHNGDVAALKAGASDYLVREQLTGDSLERALRYSIERQRSRDELNSSVERLTQMARYDDLTGLANRSLAQDQLEKALARAKRSRNQVAVLFLDLDGFKDVNDMLGHDVGDQLLKDVSKRLRDCLREVDTVARWGGDEFVVILEDLREGQGAAVVAQKLIDVIGFPYNHGEHEVFVTTSIGIAVHPQSGRDAETLLANADRAMYRAKQGGKNGYCFHEMAMNAEVGERVALETSLRRAVKCQEFTPYFQPQIDLRSGEVAGVEALLRWQDPDWGLIGPSEFMPLLEKTGLIVPVGDWFLRTACAQGRTWLEQGVPLLRMAVNLSLRQFRSHDLADTLSRILDDTGMPPQALELEITEKILMDTEHCVETLIKAKAMGVQIAIDRFGSGYTCYQQFKTLPIDAIKIDRSFISALTTSPNDAAMVTALIAMADRLGLRVVAEGVETQQQLDFLRAHGCDQVQGFVVAKPMPSAAFASWFAEQPHNAPELVPEPQL